MNLSSRHSCSWILAFTNSRGLSVARSWYSTETSHANDFVNAKSPAACREKPLLAGYKPFLNTDRVSCWFEVI